MWDTGKQSRPRSDTAECGINKIGLSPWWSPTSIFIATHLDIALLVNAIGITTKLFEKKQSEYRHLCVWVVFRHFVLYPWHLASIIEDSRAISNNTSVMKGHIEIKQVFFYFFSLTKNCGNRNGKIWYIMISEKKTTFSVQWQMI